MTSTDTTTTPTTKHNMGGDYPTNWDGFVGQTLARRQLKTAARSAKMRGTRMDHTLIVSGKPGIGKTTMALLTANEMGAKMIKVVSGKIKAGEARLMLADMDDGDALIIDEIHLLVAGGKSAAEGWLLHLLQDGVIIGPRGPEVQPAVTILGCTTDVGRLPETVIDRFPVKPTIVDYTNEEGAQIASVMSMSIFLNGGLNAPTADNCRTVALAASNNPRVMRAILITARDIALCDDERVDGDEYDFAMALEWLGYTVDGLTSTCQRYLVALLTEFAGEPAGESAMKDRLQEPGGLRHVEQLLLDKGFIVATKRGRMLTQPGIKRARELTHA